MLHASRSARFSPAKHLRVVTR